MIEYISRKLMLENLEADMIHNAKHCEPVTVKIMERFIRYVKEFPAAYVQPVKHGHWIEVTPRHSKCSICDTTCLIAVYPINKNANYCPNCGARMDDDTE